MISLRINSGETFLSLLLIVTSVFACGCNTTREILPPESRTDFILGQSYQLKKPVFLFKYVKNDPKEVPWLEKLGFGGTPLDLQEFIKQSPKNPQVAGLLMPGEQIRVVKFIEIKAPTLGTFLSVIGLVTSGESDGTIVKMEMISKAGRPTYTTFIDPEYLVPVNEKN